MKTVCSLFLLVLLTTPLSAGDRPSIEGQVLFFYYRDLKHVTPFYETILGLKKTFDEDWVKIYQVGKDSFVGLVDETRGFHKVSESKPAMLSIITGDVDGWNAHLKAQNVKFLSELKKGNAPARSFVVEDPGGYTVEFFQWTNEP